jgi:protease I
MSDLNGMKVAILAGDMVEEAELVEPREALEAAGAETILVSVEPGEILSANHFDKSSTYPVDATFDEVSAEDFEAVLLPGGALNADNLRVVPEAQAFVRSIIEENKPLAVICHGAWLLVSAGVVEGKHLTSYHTIADDLRNAGAEWTDEEVVLDGNWVSSRQPDDIPAFNDAMIKVFATAAPKVVEEE